MFSGNFTTINISDYLENKIEGFGDVNLHRAVATFSSIDRNVESFLKKNAEEFARQHKSVTYLVFSRITTEVLGFFTLAIKPITVEIGKMSKTTERAFNGASRVDQ